MSVIEGNKTMVPKMRFPEFDGAWEEKRLAALVNEFQSGVGITSSDISESGTYRVYGGNGLRGYSERYTHDGEFVLIGRQGALCGNINRANGRSYVSEHAIAASASESNSIDWLQHKLELLKLNRLSESSAQPGLSAKKLLRLKFACPPTSCEQQKIANFLDVVDRRAELLQRRREALRAFKKGMMQRLFSQELRFTRDDGSPFPDWQEKRLGEVFEWIGTNSLSREMLTDERGVVQNIHYGDIHGKFSARFVQSKENAPYLKAEVLSKPIASAAYCRPGDVVIADASEDYADIGKSIEIIEAAPNSLVAGLHTYIARPKSDELAVGFSGYLFQTWGLRRQIMRIAQGISVLGISKPNLSKLKLAVPHPAEQQRIADFLAALDARIDAVTAQLDAMQAFKKGLLQQMFV